MLKVIDVILDLPEGNVKIGEVKVETDVVNGVDEYMEKDIESENDAYIITVTLLATCGLAGEMWAYMYFVDVSNGRKSVRQDYYYVAHGFLHDEKGYKPEVHVGEILRAPEIENGIRAFYERAIQDMG